MRMMPETDFQASCWAVAVMARAGKDVNVTTLITLPGGACSVPLEHT